MNKKQTAVTNICLNCITFINLTFRMLQEGGKGGGLDHVSRKIICKITLHGYYENHDSRGKK